MWVPPIIDLPALLQILGDVFCDQSQVKDTRIETHKLQQTWKQVAKFQVVETSLEQAVNNL